MKTMLAFKSEEGKNEILKAYDNLIENWVTPNEKFYVDTRYGKTFIIASGKKEAPPVVLLHGSAMNSAMWLGDVGQYSGKYRVYAVDMPGEPGRSDERQLPFNGPDYSKWLADVFQALAIERAVIIGISLGAWLAAKFAVNYPEKAAKVVLLCPAGIGPQRKFFIFITLLHMLAGEKGMRRLFTRVNGNKPLPEVVIEYQMLIGKNFNFRREAIPIFSDDELKRLTMPVLLIAGGKDILLHSEITVKRLGELVPNAEINFIPDAGHTLINLTKEIMGFIEAGESG